VQPYHRIYAHSNPLSDRDFVNPERPEDFDWSSFYPNIVTPGHAHFGQKIAFADVGCGYGGLTVALGKRFPDKLTLAMEIRDKVAAYVGDRILELRAKELPLYTNVACVQTNAMKYMPLWFEKGQLEKMFFLFPDPHFKKKTFRRRVISHTLLAEYAYVLKEGGIIYTITDVHNLHLWMVSHLDGHPYFVRLSDEELASDPCTTLLSTTSEEARKVDRINGSKYIACYRKVTPVE